MVEGVAYELGHDVLLEDRGGRSVTRCKAEAVARALPPRNGAGEGRPRRVEVLVDRSALAVHGPPALVDCNPGAGEGVVVEVARPEERLVRPGQARHGQIEDRLANLSGRVELEAGRGETAGRQHERARPVGLRPACGVHHYTVDAAVAPLAA